MRLKLILCFSLLLAVFSIQESHAQMPVDADDSLAPMDFEEAAQLLESSLRATQSFWNNQLVALMREYDLSLSELMAEALQSNELQERFNELEAASSKFERRISIAVQSMADPMYQDRLTTYLEAADVLLLLSFLNNANGAEMTGGHSDQSEFSSFSINELVKESQVLQDRLVDLMFDERSIVALALAVEGRHDFTSLLDDGGSNDLDLEVGRQAILPVMSLLPQATLTSALARATGPAQADRLPEHLEEMIETGVLSVFGQLPFEWLVKQVEAGSLIWLNSLAMAEDGGDHPLLFEHFDQLHRSQQLKLIAISPRPEFVPVLRDAWQDAMDAAWCDRCTEPVDTDHFESLLQALTRWQTDESAEMLTRLMGMERYAEILEPRRTMIAMTALNSESEGYIRLGMNMAKNDMTVPVSGLTLGKLHRFDANGTKEIARMRVEQWSDEPDGVEQARSVSSFGCGRAALGLYAEGQGLSVDWNQWMAIGDETSDDGGCFVELASAAVADPDTIAPVLALLTEMHATETRPYRYDYLTDMARQVEYSQEQRDQITELLIDQGSWDSLSSRNQAWLLGTSE